MAVSGRLAVLALVGVLVVGVTASWVAFWSVDVALLVLVVVDLVLAGSVRGLRVLRSGDVSVRLGEPALVVLRVSNPGRRRVRGTVRDAWPPSAGVRTPGQPLDLPAGERRALDRRAACRPGAGTGCRTA